MEEREKRPRSTSYETVRPPSLQSIYVTETFRVLNRTNQPSTVDRLVSPDGEILWIIGKGQFRFRGGEWFAYHSGDWVIHPEPEYEKMYKTLKLRA
jgi:hypothetical protein